MQMILMAADHGGANLKNTLKSYLEKKGFKVVDYGPQERQGRRGERQR